MYINDGRTEYYSDIGIDQVNHIKSLINFANTLVIKDSKEAEKYETAASYDTSFKYLAAMNKADRLVDHKDRLNKKYLLEVLTPEEQDELLDKIREDIIENYVELNPYYEKLYKEKGIPYYTARMADDMEIIGHSKSFLTEEEAVRFKRLYFKSRLYFNNVIYNEAYTDFPLYRNFSRFLIVFMALESFITSELDVIHDYDIFTERSLRNMFISYDMDYFEDLPIYYQRRLLKNLNELIKHKGTNTAIINIVELFGFDDVKIFKHYLGKTYDKNKDGTYNFSKPDVHFYKIDYYQGKDFQHEIQKYPKEDYYDFVSGDPFWHAKKEEVLQEQFNLINTKYFSIESSLNIVKYNTMISYLYSTLKYIESKYDTTIGLSSKLPGELKMLGEIEFIDLVVAINYLTLKKLGYKDNIVKGTSSIALVYGFDFNARELLEKYPDVFTDEDEKWFVKNFPNDDHVSIDDFIEILNYNVDLKYELECRLLDSNDFIQYKKLQCLYDYQFRSENLHDLFEGFETYGEYLDYKNPDFYSYLNSPNLNEDKLITEILIIFEQVLQGKFRHLLESPVIYNFLRDFVIKLIEIFKFYTTKLKDFDIIYSIRDPYENRIKLIEHLAITGDGFNFEEYIDLFETFNLTGYLTEIETINVRDHVVDWLHVVGGDCVALKDKARITSIIEKLESLDVTDKATDILSIVTEVEDLAPEINRYVTSLLLDGDCVNVKNEIYPTSYIDNEYQEIFLEEEIHLFSIKSEALFAGVNGRIIVLPPIIYPMDNINSKDEVWYTSHPDHRYEAIDLESEINIEASMSEREIVSPTDKVIISRY